MDTNLFFCKLTAQLQLGNLLSDEVRVYGGFMHRMYRLDTETGTYVVKLLNPNVMTRPEAMDNYAQADRLESIVEKNDIPIIPSLFFNGKKMQEINGQYFYVYEWYGGKSLKGKGITTLHCQQISRVLSLIHHIDIKKEKYQRNLINIDWSYYIELSRKQSPVIYGLLNGNKELLSKSQNSGNHAIQNVPAVVSICHNDMDSKNVLWMNEDFRIIDLECLNYSNPYLELFELALCWSGYEECNIDFELFETFINAYFGEETMPCIDWESIYYSNYGRLEWLEYNVKRALMIECDTTEEQKLGMEQVKETMEHVIYYDKVKDDILRCLTSAANVTANEQSLSHKGCRW